MEIQETFLLQPKSCSLTFLKLWFYGKIFFVDEILNHYDQSIIRSFCDECFVVDFCSMTISKLEGSS